MKRLGEPWLTGLLALLFVMTYHVAVFACADGFSLDAPAEYLIEIGAEELASVQPDGRCTGSGPINIQVEAPDQGNQGKKWELTWRLERPFDHPMPNGDGSEIACQKADGTAAVELARGSGDQTVQARLVWALPATTPPPGEYRYRITFTAAMGAQGQGTRATHTMLVIVRVPVCVRMWFVPQSVGLEYAGPGGAGAKEDQVYIYVRCNVPWRLMAFLSHPEEMPIEGLTLQTSPGVTGTLESWTDIRNESRARQLAFGGPVREGWVLLRLRPDSSCSLTAGEYSFRLGFKLEENE